MISRSQTNWAQCHTATTYKVPDKTSFKGRQRYPSRADYQEYKLSEKDFKNLHPNDFEDLFPSQYSRKAQPSAQDRQDQSSHSSQHVDKKPGDQESCGRLTARD
ncbi:hypothetical protein Tco_1359805 [Tanacetum coccineum]